MLGEPANDLLADYLRDLVFDSLLMPLKPFHNLFARAHPAHRFYSSQPGDFMNCFAARFLCCLAIALIATVAGTKAFGCRCMGPLPPCQQFGQSTAVFIGTPISVSVKERPATRDANDEDLWTPVTFKFTVDQSFLGAPAKEIEVSTGRGGGDCGYQFKLGTPYVVYAYGSAKNRLTTSICTRFLAE